MNPEQLRQLIRQPEGLKLDFKQEFYHLDLTDAKGRERQWGELIKDVLSLANGNVNLVGETGYLIFGVGDHINPDGTRDLFDVGFINVTRQQILDKINSVCSPPLPDLNLDLLLFGGFRILVLSIPPSPYIHETMRRLDVSSGRSYLEHTILIRRGEGIHIASVPEVQAILAAKQQVTRPKIDIQTPTITISDSKPFFDTSFFGVIFTSAVLTSVWGYYYPETSAPRIVNVFISFLVGAIIGFFFALIIKGFHWFINRRPRIKIFLLGSFWLPIIGFAIIVPFSNLKNIGQNSLGILAGALFGLMIGAIVVTIIWLIDWAITKTRKAV